METIYTTEELNEFRDLVEAGESQDHMERFRSRFTLPKFIERVGRERCNTMFEALKTEYKD